MKKKLTPEDLSNLCCQVTLFNRQRWQLSNGKAERIIKEYGTEKNISILTHSISTKLAADNLLQQTKTIYFDGQIVARRCCNELPLSVSEYELCRMKKRNQQVLDAEGQDPKSLPRSVG